MNLTIYNYIKNIGINNLVVIKENILIFSILVLFTTINTILISLCLNLLSENIYLLKEVDFLLNEYENPLLKNRTISCSVFNHKASIFNPFIDLFHKSHSTYKYFPSHFQVLVGYKNDLLINKNVYQIPETTSYIAREVLCYNKYLILEHHNFTLNTLINDLYEIVSDYKLSLSS
jgi:hypothetical protein